MTADEARAYLSSLSAHRDRPGDVSNMNPEFAVRLASAIQQARAEGIPVSLTSGYRDDNTTGSSYDAGGNSSHGYGLAGDVGGLDGPNGKLTARWAQIANVNGLSNPYGIGDNAEFNHWQLPPQPLEQTPELLARLRTARASGDVNQMWAAYTPESSGGGKGQYTADQVFNAIYGQESSYGRDPNAGNNVMQIQPGTWARYAQPGEDINDRAANVAVGHRIINDLMERFGNDPAKVAVAYFTGEANVAKDGATPYINDASDGSKKVSAYVNNIMARIGAPGVAAPGAAPAVAAAAQPKAPDPMTTLGASLGQELASMSNSFSGGSGGGSGARFADPPDQPAIRAPALGADFMPPASNPVPANLAGLGSQLGSLAIQTQQTPFAGDPNGSITQGAPSMTAMLGQLGSANPANPNDPRATNTPSPYARYTRLG